MTIASFAQPDIRQNENALIQCMQTVAYRLFSTSNLWVFLKLNTRNGQIWQVQHCMRDKSRFMTSLSILPLVSEKEKVNGRFTLYPTQNFFTFILLDRIDGRTWQVQWSKNPKNRAILPIKKWALIKFESVNIAKS